MALTDAEQKRILDFVDSLNAVAKVYKQEDGGELMGALLNDTQRSFNILRSIDGRTMRNQAALTNIRAALSSAGGQTAQQVVERVARIVADADK